MIFIRRAVVIMIAFFFVCGCGRVPSHSPSLSSLWLQGPLEGEIYSTKGMLSGASLSFQRISGNSFWVTMHKWYDMGADDRMSVRGEIINGMIILEEPLRLHKSKPLKEIWIVKTSEGHALLFNDDWIFADELMKDNDEVDLGFFELPVFFLEVNDDKI